MSGGEARYSPGQLARLLGLPDPTPAQKAVIAAPLEPMAVIAGAGSGKSETMAGRLVWLAANGKVRPERVLGLTFTRKAAAELAQRVRARLDGLRRAGLEVDGSGASGGVDGQTSPWQGEPVISTYHSYAARLVADNALREALEPSLRLVSPAVSWQIAARLVAGYSGPVDAVPWAPTGTTAVMLDLAGEIAEHLRDAEDVGRVGGWLRAEAAKLGRTPARVRKILDCQRTREQLLPMAAAYAAAKAAREVMDYDDQMALAARIADRHAEVGVGERSRYQVVLLDEYQDTSHAQLVLLQALFGGGHPVTAVGDPCQSIYGWRGASAGNLLRFSRDFPVDPESGKAAAVVTLDDSFRNTGRVLAAAAVIQADLRKQAPDLPVLHAPAPRHERGALVCALLETAAEEARWVAEQIKGLLELPAGTAPDGRPWPGREQRPIRPSDIAVLCRKRSQFGALRAAIENLGIPVEVVGLGGLLTVAEVADIVATLRVLHEPAASNSLARLLTGPRWRIGPRDLVALGRRARELAADTDGRERSQPAAADPMAQVIADLSADPGSLVEALDNLGDPSAYSEVGHARLTALGAELRALRAHAGRPLPDLVGEVERVLMLDIEVAAQPWRDPATARADLDAFTAAAADFADGENAPTLGAFLAYLSAAEDEEFGLESGQPTGTDSVIVTTVHAAKGLEWPAVIVPGLAAGQKSQVFPARPRMTTRWTENPRLLPFQLRGDAGDLPALKDLTRESLDAFEEECRGRELAEERRLAYVAVTRAAFWLACSGYWWGDGVSRLGPSVFLEEIKSACGDGAGQVAEWTPPPPKDAANPALVEPAGVPWPPVPHKERQQAVAEAAAMVERAIAAADAGTAPPPAAAQRSSEAGKTWSSPGEAGPSGGAGDAGAGGQSGAGAGAAAPDGLCDADLQLIRAWEQDADLLLGELAARRDEPAPGVLLPAHLSVSALVTMASDPAELARQIRRPMPGPPAPKARRGTAFHRWLEERFGQPRLLDPADLLGAADEPADAADEAGLASLRERFEEGEWANRWPIEVEVPFEALIAGRSIRGRIDAVFADGHGGYDVVDWKTGQPPGTATGRRAVAIQLAAYRLAWSHLAQVPLGQVRAAFYYVRHDLTARPADLLDEAGLAALIEGLPAVE